MKYTKAPLSFSDQADHLRARGLIAERQDLIEALERVSYYRLSGYLFPFRQAGSDQLEPGTTLETVWDRYVFDRQLRVLVMDAIERIEVAIKAQLVTALALRHGPFAHLDRRHLPNLTYDRHRTLMDKINREVDRSREVFVDHFKTKYTSETDLPLWMAAEVMDYGCMLTLFRGVDAAVKQGVAAKYGVADTVLESWLLAGNTLRNLCAHHARLWDRLHGTAMMIPRVNKHPDWHLPVPVGRDPRRNFAQFTVLRYLLGYIAPKSAWSERMERLWTEKHPAIPIGRMGFPANWKDCPIWAATNSTPGGGTTR
ncbi:MAG: Abi family protein [Verrucomicrobiales bacterium]|nr:Abi family protein [Verrucomicrobiales bacterium]